MELLGVALVYLLATAVVWTMSPERRTRWTVAAGGIAVGVFAYRQSVSIAAGDAGRAALLARLPHARDVGDGFAGSDACRACHPDEYASWHDSFHRTMTQPARPDTVLASFDGRWLDGPGGRFRPLQRDDGFWVATASDPGAPLRRVVMTTGSHHQQRFWLAGDGENGLDLLPFSWLVADRRWVPDDAVFVMPPSIATGVAPRLWNANCVTCHSVAGVPGGDPRGGPLRTRAAELGVACEACHGPGAEHVAQNRSPLRRWQLAGRDGGDPSIVNPARLAPADATAVCAQCHAVFHWRDAAAWRREGAHFRPGAARDDDREFVAYDPDPQIPALRTAAPGMPTWMAQHFWPDGMVRISGREASAMRASQCSRGGLTCLSCHTMHRGDPDDQLRPDRRGDAACAPCHADVVAAGVAHTHHPADRPGGACMDCHMPFTTIGLQTVIRTHQITRPDVATTIASGRPDACSLCHLDRPLTWTAERLTAWWGTPTPLGLDVDDVASGVRWIVAGDAAQRALVAWHFGRAEVQAASGMRWTVPYLAAALDDPYAAVRYDAARSLTAMFGAAMPSYDFVGPAADRQAVVRRLLSEWNGSDRRGDAVLIDGDDRLDAARVDALRARRDDRPVFIAE